MLAILLVSLCYFGRRVYQWTMLRRAERSLMQRMTITRAENYLLEQRLREYERGALVESKARDNLGMIRPGEKVYLLPR